MSPDLAITLITLLVALVLFVTEKVRPDVVALTVAVILGLTGVLTPGEALAGLSSGAVVTVIAVFMLAEGLQRTGVTEAIGSLLLRLGRRGESGLVGVVMGAGALLSLIMNNTAAASLLLPAASSAARRAGVSLSRLLLPLAYATLLGGMATLLTTANIVVGGILRDNGYAGFGLLDFAPVGLPLTAAGVAYMALVGRRLLPSMSPAESARRAPAEDLAGVYRLGERLLRARIPAGSPLVGKTLAESEFRELCRATVVAIERRGELTLAPRPEARLQAGDVLVIEGKHEELANGPLGPCLEIVEPTVPARALESPAVALVEAVLAPRSTLSGQTLRDAHFRKKYGMTALALWRGGVPIRTGIRDLPLQFGDALLLQGPRDRIAVLRGEPDLIVLEAGGEEAAPPSGRAGLSVGVLVVTLALVGAGLAPTAIGLLAGAVAMILCRVLTPDQAYQSVDWRTVFLMAGMLPASTALVKTGAAELLSRSLVATLAPLGPTALLLGVFLLAVFLTQTMNGVAVAAIVAPVAILAARSAQVDPRALGMAVALACSMAFLTPLGHPVNLLVMGSGGYRTSHYFRVGAPLVLILTAVLAAIFPHLWPLTPGG